ncbi:Lysophospholipase, alpha-beta hydrolase superfamily [Modestobacter sp. DSM 44400]|uniref:alpha/beta hydrolase n=1 Tax=Modestobacter sp. DSM 44400 TaxID=1550230 RepID=UPI0008983F94|nr:alpha/beta hydrolase [Modestobacter sp. DSM 44400]SDY68430.1 Lysophospholipase, alpha-beta hydrolase superfamily [Modestobacter sp. DSM 44400]
MTSDDDTRSPEEITVPVAGGDLAALYWAADAPGAPLVVLLHGITANALTWAPVAAALAGECEVVAPDLRGRAHSAGLPGPYGLSAHAADVTALLQHFGADGNDGAQVTVLVGHSMGGFVAALATAGQARDLVHGLVLVDGGLPLAVPPAADVDAALAAVLGPSLARLDRTFPDLAAVRAFWADHPAVGAWVDSPAVAAHLARDVTGSPPELRSAVVREAVRMDGADLLDNELVLEATTDFPVPTTLLWAPRGMMGDPPGLYDEVRLAGMGLADAGVAAGEVPGTDHYSILWSEPGVAAVVGAVRSLLSR